jgi:rare lipoprotein A
MALCCSAFAQKQEGHATYYSHRLTGRKMASGIRYHKDSLFCAHRTYPFGTLLKVTHLEDGKSVIVKVTDRGPFSKHCVVDVSYEAARRLGIIHKGRAMVSVEPVKNEE